MKADVVGGPVTVAILGAGSRGSTYAKYAEMYPDCMKVVGVADINNYRQQKMAKKHGIAPEHIFGDWSEAFAVAKFADVVVISLPDNLHYAPAMKKDAIVGVCHVLRYAPYFIALKEVTDSGRIGRLISIQHTEPIKYHHMAHSYVRGNWHNSKETTPIILAKSCNDLDILRWLADSPCKSISAYGSLSYFTHENRPKGAPARCTDGCPYEGECPYSAIDIYVRKNEYTYVFDNLPPKGDPRRAAELTERLKTTNYGRCVERHCGPGHIQQGPGIRRDHSPCHGGYRKVRLRSRYPCVRARLPQTACTRLPAA